MTEEQMQPVQENGWRGMFANRRLNVPNGHVLLAENFYLDDGTWRPRPGTVKLGSTLGNGTDKVQGIIQYEELDGTYHLLAFVGGNMFEYDWVGGSWTETDLSANSIAMDSGADLDFCLSRGRLIVTDGVNDPWMWDGSSFTTLTNAPIASGCTIYYDRVFFYEVISNRVEFQWSNVADPVNGYGGDNQAWEFAQADTGSIAAMVGLNDFMPVFKQDSIGRLTGRVSDQFQTDAVREGISETEGAIALRSVQVIEKDVFYLSQVGPRALIDGMQRVQINETDAGDDFLEDEWSKLNVAERDRSITVYDQSRGHVLFMIPTTDEFLSDALVFNIKNGSWQKFSFAHNVTAAVGPAEDPDGNEWVLLGDDSGNVYQYGDATNTSDDGAAITFTLRSKMYGREIPTVLKRLIEARFLFNLPNASTTGEVRPVVDLETKTGKTFNFSKTGRQRYRRGFNHVGYGVGWELFVDGLDEEVEVESVLVRMTQAGIYETV